MERFICTACGTQYPPRATPPERCPICEDERQYVPKTGQGWTTLAQLELTHANCFRQLEPDLIGIWTQPHFAIGERALLIRTPAGNVLWDCISFLDNATVTLIEGLGGLSAIAISHPHFYTTMNRWAEAFDAPVHLHAADRDWVQEPGDRLVFWDGARQALAPGLTLVHCGGHFAGSTVLHWAAGADGKGALLSGDTCQVVEDHAHVSFLRSYPNLLPLGPRPVRRIVEALAPLAFERVYSGFLDGVIESDGKRAVTRSAERYLRWISADGADDALA